MNMVQVWVCYIGAPGSEMEQVRAKVWLPKRLALAGGYELVMEEEREAA